MRNTLAQIARAFDDSNVSAEPGDPSQAAETDRLQELVRQLKSAKKAVVVCGTDTVTCDVIRLASELAGVLNRADIEAGLFYTLGGANDFAIGMTGAAGIDQTLSQIEAGKIRALIAVENDLRPGYPDQTRLTRVLDHLELLIVLDHVASPLVEQAQFFIPTQTVYEAGGHWVNNEGRLQAAEAGFRGGESIEITGDQDHPPREFASEIPGTVPLSAWQAIAGLAEDSKAASEASSEDYLAEALKKFHPALAGLKESNSGQRLDLEPISEPTAECSGNNEIWQEAPGANEIDVLLVDRTFGTEPLSAMSPVLTQEMDGPAAGLHPSDIQKLGLDENKNLVVTTDAGSLELPMAADDRMAPGVIVIPRHHELQWQIFEDTVVRIKKSQIKPV